MQFRVGQPRARLIRTSALTLSAVNQPIPWEAADYQDQVGWDSGGTLTDWVCPITGLYALSATARRNSQATSQRFALKISIDANTRAEEQIGPDTGNLTCCLATQFEIVEGMIVQVVTAGDLGGSLQSGSSGRTHLEITRIGPKRWTN